MSDDWPRVPLRDLLKKSKDWIEIKPDCWYRQVTVRLWGQGVVERNKVSGAEIAGARRLVVRGGQFVLSRIDARNGAFGVVPEDLDRAVVSNDFPAFDVQSDRILPSYLDWLSKTHNFVALCKAASEGTTNRVRLKEDRFLSMTIPLPPLEDQQRTVARIEELASKLDEARRLQRGTETSIHRMLLSAYTEIARDAPSLPVSQVAPLIRRPVQVELSRQYHELGIRSFGKGTFHKPAVDGTSLGNKRIFRIEAGDLVFNIVFAWEGAVAVARDEDHGRVGSHRFLTCVPMGGLATAPYLCFHFLTDRGLQQLGEASPGGAGRNRTLGIKALERTQVPIPPLEKQVWFDTIVRKVDEVKRLKAESGTELDAMLPSILDKAFKGEL